MTAPRLDLTTANGTTDISRLCASMQLSGNYRQCCRTLTLDILVSAYDKSLPQVYFPLGGTVRLYVDEKCAFYGHVFTKNKSTDSGTMTVTCFDRGIYLKQNAATYNFKGKTPEAIAQRVCADFGISVYGVTATGVRICRKYADVSLYSILESAYTLASQQTGDKYFLRFVGGALGIFIKGQNTTRKLLAAGVNLAVANYAESIESMVNRVSIYDSNDNFVKSVSDADAIRLYGLMRQIVRQSKDEDATAEANKMLEEGGVSRTVTVTVLGDIGLVTGEAVTVREPFTGLNGLFWIDGDTHIWAKGIWTTKLTLNFRNMMNEDESGTEDS